MRDSFTRRWPDILAWAAWLGYLASLGVMLFSLLAPAGSPGGSPSRLLALLASPSIREALVRTHAVSAIATGLVLIAGVLFIFSWRLRAIQGLHVILRAPLLLHGIPAALAYLIVFGNAGLINRALQGSLGLSQAPLPLAFTTQGLILFFVLFGLPYFLAYTLHGIGPETADLEDAARLLGAGPAEVFRRVTLPLLSGHLKAALALVYILAAGSLSVPMVIGGAKNSLLTAEIYSLVVTFSDLEGAAALSLGLMVSLLFPLLWIDRAVAWGGSWISRMEIGFGRLASRRDRRKNPGSGRGSRVLAQTARGYQSIWLILLAVLVISPLYASFVLDWGAGILPSAWTLRWYGNITPQFWESIRLSLILSCGCVAISLLVGLPLALTWRFGALPARRLLKALVLLPIGVPGFLWGLSLLILSFRWAPTFARGPWILLVGQSFLALPFMTRVLMSALEQFDGEYLSMGRILGAGPGGVIRRVLLPMLLPSVGVGAVLVFVRTFGESNLALIAAPAAYPTAPLWLYEAIGISGIGAASVLEVFLVIIPLAVLLAWERWLRRKTPWAEVRAILPIG